MPASCSAAATRSNTRRAPGSAAASVSVSTRPAAGSYPIRRPPANHSAAVTSSRSSAVTSARSGAVTSARSGSVTGVRSGSVTGVRSGAVTRVRSAAVTGTRSGRVAPEVLFLLIGVPVTIEP